MPTPTKGPRLGGSPSHQRLILANLATSLFEHGQIKTTETKARRLRPYAEHLITKAKHDSLANRRQVVKAVRDKSVLHTLFTEIGPRFATRPGGYTRITKLGPRQGDNAPMALIELVEEREFAEQTKPKKSQKKAEQTVEPVEEAPSDEADEAAESVEEAPADEAVESVEEAPSDEADEAAESVEAAPEGDEDSDKA